MAKMSQTRGLLTRMLCVPGSLKDNDLASGVYERVCYSLIRLAMAASERSPAIDGMLAESQSSLLRQPA